MADTTFYKFLEAAFRYKLFKKRDATSFKSPPYNLPYEGSKGIFDYARKILPSFYAANFPDTKEGHLQMAESIINKLDRKLDPTLEKYFDPVNTPEGYETLIAEAQAVSQQTGQAPVGEPAAAMAGGSHFPSIPGSPIIHNIPQVNPSNTPSKTPVPKATDPTKSAPKSAPQVSKPSFQAPRIPSSFTNTARNFGSRAGIFFKKNSGRIAGGLGQIAKGVGRGIAGPGLTSTYNLLGKVGTGGINAFASLSNQAAGRGAFVKGSSKKLAVGLIAALLLFVIGAGALGALTGTTPIGEAGPIGSGCPDTSANRNEASCHYLNPSIDIFNTTISQSIINSYIVKNSPIFINAGKGDLAEFTKRTNYIVTNSQQAGLNPAIFLGYWKSESNFSTVGSRDLGCAGDNFYEQVDCALGINTFSNPVKNPIASCARSRDANSSACTSLKSVRQTFDKTHPIKYPVATFDDFAEAYGPYDDLSNGLHTNCTHTYNDLIDTAKELNSCITSSAAIPPPPGQPPAKEFALSCPINNENNTCSHAGDPRDDCHCKEGQYLSMDACRADASLYFGIDVGTKISKTALIPYITYQGETTPQSITCQLITAQSPTCPASGCEPQQILHYHCPTNKVDLYLQYNHIKASSSFPATISSGQAVGDVANYGDGLRRLNIQVGVGGECAYGQTQYCKPGGDYFQCPLQKEPAPDY